MGRGHFSYDDSLEKPSFGDGRGKGSVLGLVQDMALAVKIAQAAKRVHLQVRNFDSAVALIAYAKDSTPVVVILDWDQREAESFKLLSEFLASSDLMNIPAIGVVSQSKAFIKEEAQRAGCHRVFSKTEFLRELDNIFVRYIK